MCLSGGAGAGARRNTVPANSTSNSSSTSITTAAVTSRRPTIITQEGIGSTPSRQTERAREVLGQGVASQAKTEALQDESPSTIIDTIRLLLSCLHAWRLDDALDRSCEQVLGLVQPCKPVSFGLLSKGSCMSLVLPGWGLRLRQLAEKRDGAEFEVSHESPLSLSSDTSTKSSSSSPKRYTFDQKYHLRWQLSRSLTTQHLLTMVSITNTLMNQTVGAQELASSSGSRLVSHEEDSDSDGEDQTSWDNQIRAVWSRVRYMYEPTCTSVLQTGVRGQMCPGIFAPFPLQSHVPLLSPYFFLH